MSKLNFSKLKRQRNSSDADAQGTSQALLSRFFSPVKSNSGELELDEHAAGGSASGARSLPRQDHGASCQGRGVEEESGKCVEMKVTSPFRKRSHTRSPNQDDERDKKKPRNQGGVSNQTQDKLSCFQSLQSAKTNSVQSDLNGSQTGHNSGGSLHRQKSAVKVENEKSKGMVKHRKQNSSPRPSNKKIPPEISPEENSTDLNEDLKHTPSTSKTSPGTISTPQGSPLFAQRKSQFGSAKREQSRRKSSPNQSPLLVDGPLKWVKYTPLELQFLEIKKENPDTLLFVECGYKYKFFGQDAEIAAKELNIFCHPDHNFMVASIPVHRLFVHTRRLVAKGHKVGVVKQTETAALKAAGENRSAPFQRKLAALYTKSTLIGEDVDPASQSSESADSDLHCVPSNYLLCLSEFTKPKAKTTASAKVEFGLVAVQPATGDIIYDSFHDNDHLSELDTRIHHIQPVELLLPNALTDKTEKLVQDIVASSTTADDRIRIERMDSEYFEYCQALEVVSSFYGEEDASCRSKEKQHKGRDSSNRKLQEVLSLPVPVICCLAALVRYLKEFQLHRVLRMTSNLMPFSASRLSMKLDACALRNLEIFQNQTDGSARGSLFWVLDHTKTRFGSRLLRKWLAMPLMDVGEIKRRQDAVEEVLHSDCEALNQTKDLVVKAPDLEKGICSIYHKKCSCWEFYTVVKSLSKLSHALSSLQELAQEELTSELLRTIFKETPSLLEDVDGFLNAINEKAAKDGKKTELFCDTSPFPAIVRCQQNISELLEQIQDHVKEPRRVLRKPMLEYTTVSGIEFLVEIKNNLLKEVPNTWVKISSTKQVTRYHTPFLVKACKTISQLREELAIDCQNAWLQFLDSFGDSYFAYRKAVHHLAALDCLFALAELAQQEGYCRPVFNEDGPPCVHIKNGKHPVVSTLLGEQEQYVPNSTHLEGTGQRCMVITGPNMGGKSSYIRQVALITIMAQVGSWVPAESATLGVLDAVYTRMGASDNICQRRSTFMVELQEASDILSRVTERSLVILDELGRGTSTHDGVAIAHATARHFIQEVKCLLLFVTHYPPLAELERLFPHHVDNYHMAFLLHDNKEEQEDKVDIITFLYQLVPGMAARSYGLNVARLAEIPAGVLKMAATKSHELEDIVMASRNKRSSFRKLWRCQSASTKTILQDFKTTK